MKLEYQYINLGRRTTNAAEFILGTPTPFADNTTTRIDFHTVRIGLNYRWGGPVVAKYRGRQFGGRAEVSGIAGDFLFRF